MKRIFFIILLLLLLFLPSSVFAAGFCGSWGSSGTNPWTVSSNSGGTASAARADVAACISSASAGNTINIPTATASWSTGVSLGSKKLTIAGAGVGSTIINSTVSGASTIDLGTGGSTLTDLKINGGYVLVNGQNFAIGRVNVEYTGAIGAAVSVNFGDGQHPTGVIYSGHFINCDVGVGGTGSSMDGGQSYRYAQTFTLGDGVDIVYIEDCIFERNTNVAQQMNAIDANYGARYVFRYNTLHTLSSVTSANLAFYVECHSVQGVNRGTQRWEVYGNLLNNQGGFHYYPFRLRSGTGVVAANSVIGNWTIDGIGLDNRRSTESFSVCGKCDSDPADGWDGHQDGTGYPCRDQIGRGHDTVLWKYSPVSAYTQVLMPAYAWNNRNDTSAIVPFNVLSGSTDHIKENRDYYNYTTTFNGTSGVGCGTLASRPATCTEGVAYWATNQSCSDLSGMVGANPTTPLSGTLYKCTATDTWTEYYTPYTYPHPLSDGDATSPIVSSASIGPSDTALTINFSETVVTTGYDDGDFDIDCVNAGNDIAANTISGSGSSRTFTLASTVYSNDTCTLDYSGGADEIEDAAGNDLAVFNDGIITNNSGTSPPGENNRSMAGVYNTNGMVGTYNINGMPAQ